MVELSISNKFLAVSNDTCTITVAYNKYPCDVHEINRLMDIVPENGYSSTCSSDISDGHTPIVSSSFSSSGELFVCCSQKYLSVWKTNDWSLVGKKTIQRSANKVIFSPSNKIFLADKSGDVYLHNLNDFDAPGELILGHLSVLLDILVTPDEKYVITCDRDEKIRVSSLPNSYNINSYCLGHTDFVTSISLVPHNPVVLLSSGGDGTIRFWDYLLGKELLCHEVTNDNLDLHKDEMFQVIVQCGTVCNVDSNCSLLFSSIFKFNAIVMHIIKSTSSVISCELLQTVRTDYSPICFRYCSEGKSLWIISNKKEKPLHGFEVSLDNIITACKPVCNYQDNNNPVCNTNKDQSKLDLLPINDYIRPVCGFASEIQEALKKHPSLFNGIELHERFICSLTKKRFNNEGEYYKRKQERLDLKGKKSKSSIEAL